MLRFLSGNGAELSREMLLRLKQYRYAVFIEKLGWSLPVAGGLESDEFDHADTLYVVALSQRGDVTGCGRLLPTSGPYLLGSVFPGLMGNAALPGASDVWELSRFAISTPDDESLTAEQAWDNTRGLMAEIVRVAQRHGAQRLIAFSVLGNERLLRRMGVSVRRAAPPQLIDGKPTVPFWVAIDERTLDALDLEAAPCRREAAGPGLPAGVDCGMTAA
ncbi:acyl-homoserine-lactone synthase [Burkholderia alba]|uniref:acyl-homoserine-lactone synthase n=1 Tax=Burkholderia alba TaxID=2683677 RepID=UPI002B056EA9|nr:acyl-homoserine-lactone synthase [Burkholderia alba]